MIHKHFVVNFVLPEDLNSVLASYDAERGRLQQKGPASYSRIKRCHVEMLFSRQAWKNNWITEQQVIGGEPVGTASPPKSVLDALWNFGAKCQGGANSGDVERDTVMEKLDLWYSAPTPQPPRKLMKSRKKKKAKKARVDDSAMGVSEWESSHASGATQRAQFATQVWHATKKQEVTFVYLKSQSDGTKKIMYMCGGHTKPHEVDANYILESEPKVSRVSCHARRPLQRPLKASKLPPCAGSMISDSRERPRVGPHRGSSRLKRN